MSYSTRFSARSHSVGYGLAATIFLFLCGMSLPAQNKPQVSVHLVIDYENYQSFYDLEPGLSIAQIESAATDALVLLLNAHFPFIEFTRITAPDKITFTMTEGIVTEIKVVPILTKDNTTTYATDPFSFRDAIQALDDPPPTRDAFVQELNSKFSEWINAKRDNLITELFGNVSVGKNAVAFPSSKKWIMPFKMEQMQIGARSSLQVVTKIQGPLGVEHCDYNTIAQGPVTTSALGSAHIGKMFCNIEGSNSNCPSNLAFIEIEGIYLKKFIKLGSTESSPGSFDFSGQ